VLGTLLVMAIVIAVGTRASDGLQVKQQEAILASLPEPEALAFYDLLRRRLRKIQVLRVIALLALVTLFYAYKHHLAPPAAGPAPVSEKK
jgi:hypothetical protein